MVLLVAGPLVLTFVVVVVVMEEEEPFSTLRSLVILTILIGVLGRDDGDTNP